jgi:predicted small secreted protein
MIQTVFEQSSMTRAARRLIVILVLLAIITLSGCSNAGEGALSGAGIGALSGLAIGSISGNAGGGAAIGAVVGGVGGAVIGDQNRRQSEAAAAQQSAATATPQPVYQTGQAIGRLVGQWRIAGTIDLGGAGTASISGTARGSIDKTYFVRIESRFNDPRSGQVVEGTSVISQTGGRGIEMTNSFSTSPVVRHFKGEMDESGSVFNLSQFDPPMTSRKVIIRMPSNRGWTADVWDNGKRLESYEFISTGP